MNPPASLPGEPGVGPARRPPWWSWICRGLRSSPGLPFGAFLACVMSSGGNSCTHLLWEPTLFGCKHVSAAGFWGGSSFQDLWAPLPPAIWQPLCSQQPRSALAVSSRVGALPPVGRGRWWKARGGAESPCGTGYYFTGDGAYRTEEGYYQITGRMDDVINISGHRLGTAEIEDAMVSLADHLPAPLWGPRRMGRVGVSTPCSASVVHRPTIPRCRRLPSSATPMTSREKVHALEDSPSGQAPWREADPEGGRVSRGSGSWFTCPLKGGLGKASLCQPARTPPSPATVASVALLSSGSSLLFPGLLEVLSGMACTRCPSLPTCPGTCCATAPSAWK